MSLSRSKLPRYCYRQKGRTVYKPYLGRQDGKVIWGTPVRLGPADMTVAEVWAVYDQLHKKATDTLRWLLEEYNASPQFQALSPWTQKNYRGYLEVICRYKTKTGQALGDFPLSTFTRITIRKYLDTYRSPQGVLAPKSANKHVQYISAAWNWAMERFAHVPVNNPCLGVKKNAAPPRSRYVTHEEYSIVYSVALTMRVPYFAPAMELAYLCRARRNEVFGLTHDDLLNEGILLRRSKGSRGEITLWNPRLKHAVAEAKKIWPEVPVRPGQPHYLFHDKQGKAYTKNALDSAWERIMDKAMDPERTKPPLMERFTYHDLKAKGATDSKRENAAGHKSKKMEAVYDRLPKQVEIDYG
jgi:integrase